MAARVTKVVSVAARFWMPAEWTTTRRGTRQGSAVPAAPTARRSRRWGSRCTLADTFLCVRPSTSHATAEPLVRVVNNAQSSRSKRFWVRLSVERRAATLKRMQAPNAVPLRQLGPEEGIVEPKGHA